MDIEKIWQQQEPIGNDLPEITSVSEIKEPVNPSPLKRMKKMLLTNMIWVVLITIIYIVILFSYHYWQIQCLFILLLGFNAWGLYSAIQLYKCVNVNVMATNLLDELKRNQIALKQWMEVQAKVALFIYPFSACAGFMLGGVVGSGKSLSFFMSKPWVVLIMVVLAILLTPVGHWAAKWMFKKSFGKVITHLDQSIAELSSPD